MLATLAMILFPSFALAQGGGGTTGGGADPGPAPAKISLKISGLKGGKAKVGDRVEVVGTVTPFVGHQKVQVRLGNGGDTVLKANPYVRQVKGKNYGRFKLRSKPLLDPGKYRARAQKKKTDQQAGGAAKSKRFSLKFIDLDPGDRGPAVDLFNDLMRAEGYYDTDKHNYGSHTERAVMAFRKVNGMARNFQATPGIFKALAEGKGGFQPKYPNDGKHVEVDISKQVMALVDDGEAKYVFHDRHRRRRHALRPGRVHLLPQGPGLQLARDVLLGLLQPRRSDPRLRLGAAVSGQPRLHPQPDPRLGLHLQLDRPRRQDVRVQLGRPWPTPAKP